MKPYILLAWLGLAASTAGAAELAGIFVDDEIRSVDGQKLVLNGMGLREKFWIDVYVGSLYLPEKSSDVAEILSRPGPWRIQMDFIYKEVAQDQLVDTWKEGFENNQSAETLQSLAAQFEQFYGFFDSNVVKGEKFTYDYVPGQGVLVSRNGKELGLIPGDDFKTALLEIWLGNSPADKQLKQGMLGL